MGGESARADGQNLLLRERAGEGDNGDCNPVAGEEHGETAGDIDERVIGAIAAECAAVIVGHGGEGVEDFAEAVRAAVKQAAEAHGRDDSDGGADEDAGGRDQDGDGDHFHVEGFDLLAEIFGRAADHEAGEEDGENGEENEAVNAGPGAAENDFAELHEEHGDHAADGSEGIMHGVNGAVGSGGGDGGPEGGIDNAETDFFSFEVALFGVDGDEGERDENEEHDREEGPALALVTDHLAEGAAEGGGDEEDGEHLQEVGEWRGVFEGMSGVGVKEAAAIRTELFDRDLRGGGTHGEELGGI